MRRWHSSHSAHLTLGHCSRKYQVTARQPLAATHVQDSESGTVDSRSVGTWPRAKCSQLARKTAHVAVAKQTLPGGGGGGGGAGLRF